ncbi:MAG: 3-hydroxyacyl-CoA dehydrogenase family protein [Woeseia sp.]
MLLDADDVHEQYAWEILSNTLCYAATLVPDVNESLVSIDDAMKLGYNWIQGPFELIDTIGIDRFISRLDNEDRDIPAFLRCAAGKSFYRVKHGRLEYLGAHGGYRALSRAPGVIRFSEERRKLSPLRENHAASYYALPEEVGIDRFLDYFQQTVLSLKHAPIPVVAAPSGLSLGWRIRGGVAHGQGSLSRQLGYGTGGDPGRTGAWRWRRQGDAVPLVRA